MSRKPIHLPNNIMLLPDFRFSSDVTDQKELGKELEDWLSQLCRSLEDTFKQAYKDIKNITDVLQISTDGDVYTEEWTDYSATSTVTGWSSFTIKKIYYKKLGNLVFVCFDIEGTSNSTSAYFTLPHTSVNSSVNFGGCLVTGVDNGSGLTVACRLILEGNSSTVYTYTNMNNGTWTNSGTKRIGGSFWYEAA